MPPPRIALIHALAHSVAPVNEAFARDWPDAQLMNLLDDSLSADLARAGALDAAMNRRFETLASYALQQGGAQAILFTCSAFGPSIEAVARARPAVPIFKPNEAMVAEAGQSGAAVGLVATFGPTLVSMPPEFAPGVLHHTALATGALDALNRGDTAAHDALIVRAALEMKARGCMVIALAQFSMARAKRACEVATGLQVLTTVDSALRALQQKLAS